MLLPMDDKAEFPIKEVVRDKNNFSHEVNELGHWNPIDWVGSFAMPFTGFVTLEDLFNLSLHIFSTVEPSDTYLMNLLWKFEEKKTQCLMPGN